MRTLTRPYVGKIEKIGGIDCYVATPEGEYAKDKVLLYIPDIFGYPLVNHKARRSSHACVSRR